MYKDYPAAYQVSKGSALQVDTAFYERVRDSKDQRTLIEQFEVPIRTGRAWHVPAGHVFRVTTPAGPQVGTSTSGMPTTRGSVCGRRVPGSCRARMSVLTIGCGRTCRSCGRW